MRQDGWFLIPSGEAFDSVAMLFYLLFSEISFILKRLEVIQSKVEGEIQGFFGETRSVGIRGVCFLINSNKNVFCASGESDNHSGKNSQYAEEKVPQYGHLRIFLRNRIQQCFFR